MKEPTPCETCDFVHETTRDKPFYRWICYKFPRLEGMNPIAPTQAVVASPYNFCERINLGHCPCWQPRREAKKDDV